MHDAGIVEQSIWADQLACWELEQTVPQRLRQDAAASNQVTEVAFRGGPDSTLQLFNDTKESRPATGRALCRLKQKAVDLDDALLERKTGDRKPFPFVRVS
ncbi:MAG TPA: hypothetical protein VHD81_00315 [Mycobacteriales bacterium]|nr:hypothetical protein [Mycobacteriales bacterium]